MFVAGGPFMFVAGGPFRFVAGGTFAFAVGGKFMFIARLFALGSGTFWLVSTRLFSAYSGPFTLLSLCLRVTPRNVLSAHLPSTYYTTPVTHTSIMALLSDLDLSTVATSKLSSKWNSELTLLLVTWNGMA
jgi:hypothetical protein